MDASIAVDLLGRSCVSILSESLKSYFETLQYRVIGFSLAGSKQGIEGKRCSPGTARTTAPP
jgi:hypothetical protein